MAKAKIGRPRSEKSREAVLNAANALLNESGGSGLSVEAIARRAGVGKPTIYRWWPTLADIVLEVLRGQADAAIAVPSGNSLPETLRRFLGQSVHVLAAGSGVHLRFLMAHAQRDEDFRQRFRENLVGKRRAVLLAIFRQAVERGWISPEQNLDLAVDMVFGAMWYRLLVGHAPMDESFARELAEAAMALLRTNPA